MRPGRAKVNPAEHVHAARVTGGPRLSSTAWAALQDAARAAGFDALGAVPAMDLARARAEVFPGAPAATGLEAWLAEGRHGALGYMEHRAEARRDLRLWWPPARTALVGLVSHDSAGEPGDTPEGAAPGARARVSRYAWGRDYHLVVRGMLKLLARALEREAPGSRWILSVDRHLAMEKPLAVLAGLGWIGKHGNLLRTEGSSWWFIGVLVTDAELDRFEPFETDHCGTCTACLDACPTGAIVAPQVVDARRCISYLTVEIARATDPALRERQGAWVFGCDACQDVCPWNAHRSRKGHPRFADAPVAQAPLLRELLRLDDAGFAALTPKSAMKRGGRPGLVRSAATAAGNAGEHALVPDLDRLLRDDPSAAVRCHAAWALGRLGGPAARAALERALGDADEEVRAEARAALSG